MRVLVGHANLLDSVMFGMAADDEQEPRFIQSLRAGKPASGCRNRIAQESSAKECIWHADPRSENVGLSKPVSASIFAAWAQHVDIDEEEMVGYDLEEDYIGLELGPTSRSSTPLDLLDDCECRELSEKEATMLPLSGDASLPRRKKPIRGIKNTYIPTWTSRMFHKKQAPGSRYCHYTNLDMRAVSATNLA
jgi:hypothetical protein